MDIQSKAWHVRTSSVVLGSVEITSRQSGQTRFVANGEIPHHGRLGQIHEREFDKIVALAFDEGTP